MRNVRGSIISVVFAIAAGVVVLLGYFLKVSYLPTIGEIFLHWAVLLAAAALLVGVANLLRVHGRKIATGEHGSTYSLVLILSLVSTVVVAGFFGPTSYWGLWVFNNIQVPVEASLMAVLAAVLAYASARLLNRRLTFFSLVFVGTVLLVLIGTATLPGFEIPGLTFVRDWVSQVPATAGARGILLGVALGTLATGLRILSGSDRPYGS